MGYRRRYYRKRYYKSNYVIDKSFFEVFLYFLFLPFILLGYCVKLIFSLVRKINSKKVIHDDYNIKNENFEQINHDVNIPKEENHELNVYNDIGYQQKESLVTNHEKYFYDIFEKNFSDKYKIQTQVNLASVVSKLGQFRYQNELYRNIDFGFFEKETLKPLLLIKINDATHEKAERYARDLKVRNILNQAGIKLLTFYSFYDNREDYIIDRIKKTLAE